MNNPVPTTAPTPPDLPSEVLLFRSPVLDESWSVGDAANVYGAAMEVVDHA